MQTTVTKTFGNFKWTGVFEIPDSAIPAIIENGVAQIAQRSPASAAEKEMAGYTKRPEKFQRVSIPFSEANAAILSKALSKLTLDVSTDESKEELVDITGTVTVEQYTPGEGAVPKYQAFKEFVRAYLAKAPDRTVAKFAANRELAAPVEPWEEDSAFLAAGSAWLKAEIAKRASED